MLDPRRSGRHLARMVALVALAWAALTPQVAAAQKPTLDHDAYDVWRVIRGERISPDGAWALYQLAPRVGDTELVATRRGDPTHRFDRGGSARFSPDSRFLAFTIAPAHDSVRTLRLARTRRDDMPVDTLAIVELATGEMVRIAGARSWRLPEKGASILAYLVDPAPPAETDAADTTAAEATAPPSRNRKKPETRTLVVRELESGLELRVPDVVEFALDETGSTLAYATATEDGVGDGVHVRSPAMGDVRTLVTGEGAYTRLTVDEGGRVAFLTDRDDPSPTDPELALYVWTGGRDGARRIAGPGVAGIPGEWAVRDRAPRFSDNGRRLFFGTGPRPVRPETTDTLPTEEQVRLDVWHWQDPHIQPMQLLAADGERRRSFQAVAHLDRRDRIVQLETPELPSVTVGSGGDADVALAETDVPYRALVGIESPGFSDLWVVDVGDGERRRILERRQIGGAALSPGSSYAAWYDFEDRHWHALDIRRNRQITLTDGVPHPLWNEEDDRPMHPTPYGRAGWTEGDRQFLVYDRYDIWALDPTGRAAPRRVTDGGRERGLRFRYVDLEPGEPAIPAGEPLLLSAFDERTKDAGFFQLRPGGGVTQLVLEPKQFGRPVRASDSGALLFTRQDVAEFPDLWVSGPWLETPVRVSHANPQQTGYNWATVELVEWLSTAGVPLQGLVYRPEDFDPSRQYPMMVYFYERGSDNLHQHTPPLPHRSVIRPTFYASRGYIVFVPDIVYQEGYPGKSAMDAVMPGTLMLAAEPWVDASRIGVQGHSWGGYQIAYMITQTNVFRAAGAGAPVANMTSAYGGIRWGTGHSRIFQYERTQSRIAGSLWEQRDRFIENSPLFYLDRVETPLLIMHNDEDGAVPFEQGIELFMGLRRLGKPTWMINYNKEPHWPTTAANIRDWNIRMQQFFDFYLMGAPAPAWMAEGIPAVRKGETLGLDPVEMPGMSPLGEAFPR
jgi:dipeptidyl aminopeptidase/acylaminoacyl peptidase